ncbi:hypothetical protein K7X08_004068 [Anisodus acutangulus]|uniref:Uncharacterized protein n=1 Tax=Anisodus acutangulus TaxID=402998 RepID=A0A9Q1RJZ3_9SOLA|nr:hypothetical protein K7X08_004068 [Anisodus acutangulus]
MRSADGRVNALYSSPSIYTDAKYDLDESWPLKTDDYFPYADRINAYWTGYFTSRPALKLYVRMMSGYYLSVALQSNMFSKRLFIGYKEAEDLVSNSIAWIDPSYSLADNVAIISLQELEDHTVLLRLAHLYEVDEDKDLSTKATVELKRLFPKRKINKIKEMSLSANQEREELEKKR